MQAKILLVEDNLLSLLHMETLLSSVGHTVCGKLTKAEEVANAVKQHQPDLILLDCMLKGEMTGIDAALQLRHYYQMPILFITALTDYSSMQAIKNISNSRMISKPFDEGDVIENIDRLLD